MISKSCIYSIINSTTYIRNLFLEPSSIAIGNTANLKVENNHILAVKSAKVVRFFGISLKNGPGTDIRVSLRVNHSKLISLIKLGLNWRLILIYLTRICYVNGTSSLAGVFRWRKATWRTEALLAKWISWMEIIGLKLATLSSYPWNLLSLQRF